MKRGKAIECAARLRELGPIPRGTLPAQPNAKGATGLSVKGGRNLLLGSGDAALSRDGTQALELVRRELLLELGELGCPPSLLLLQRRHSPRQELQLHTALTAVALALRHPIPLSLFLFLFPWGLFPLMTFGCSQPLNTQ